MVRVEDTSNIACAGYDNAYLPYGSGDIVKILSHFVPVQYSVIPCSNVVGEVCNYRSLPWLQTYLFIILSGTCNRA